MTRPRKQTVDWFPHAITHGRTIFTLEQRYGIAGYAFWFKLLELLGNTEGHFLDLKDGPTIQYLQAYTHTDEKICPETLDLLANLGAIDKDLWREKIVWSQGFVDALAELYARRKVALPTKASILAEKNPNREIEDITKLQEDCRKITRKAIEEGTLIKLPCEICGTTEKIEPHHTDYSKPFEVRWLCKAHHTAWHNCERNALSDGLLLAETSFERFIEVRKLARERVEREKKSREREEEKDIHPSPPKKAKTKIPLPENFAISDAVRKWAEANSYDRLEEHLESFRDNARAKGWLYVDWDAHFRNFIRGDWGHIRASGPLSPGGFKKPKATKAIIEAARLREERNAGRN